MYQKSFNAGIKDGLPIGLGYFAVAFSLGIAARNAGLTPLQGFLASLLNNASAGEYAGFTVIAAGGSYLEIILVTFIANARYMLMSCALSQKFGPATKFFHRILIGFDNTDEIFGLAVSQEGYLNPKYIYGVMLMAIPGWSIGTALGIIAGNILPKKIVVALSVALYGMFLAIIIPPAKKDKIIALSVILSFFASFLLSRLAPSISEGTRTIILTVVIGTFVAICFPREDEDEK